MSGIEILERCLSELQNNTIQVVETTTLDKVVAITVHKKVVGYLLSPKTFQALSGPPEGRGGFNYHEPLGAKSPEGIADIYEIILPYGGKNHLLTGSQG